MAARESRVRFVSLVLVGLGIIVFLAGLIVASKRASTLFSIPHEAVISALVSPLENPRGYLIAAAAIAICGALMLPAVRTVFVGLRETGMLISGVGSLLLALGFLGEISLGCMAGLWSIYDHTHMILAFATFIAIAAGLTICLTLAARLRRNYGLLLLAAIQLIAVAILVYMLFNPGFPPERSFLTSLAFAEWLLCLSFIISLLALVASVAFPVNRREASGEAVALDS